MNELLGQISEKYIPFWLSMLDPRGGFYGSHVGGVIERDAPKGAIQHFKILWFFSRAFQVFKDPKLRVAADHAYRFIIDSMMDKEFGGFYDTVRFDGMVTNRTKHANAFALALYAFTAYFDASGEYAVLKNAYECFNTLEFRCRREFGYHEQFDGIFTPIANTKMSDLKNVCGHVKTYLNILSAYIDFFHTSKDENVRVALEHVYEIIRYRIFVEDTGSLDVYLDKNLDTEYDVLDAGINMQASWLMTNAALALGKFVREDASVVKRMVDATLRECFDNPAMSYRKYPKKMDSDRLGWVQAEGIVGLINMYTLTKQENYLDKAKSLWGYVKNNLMLHGGWSFGKTKLGKLMDKPLVSPESGPFHEARMFFEVLRRGVNIGL